MVATGGGQSPKHFEKMFPFLIGMVATLENGDWQSTCIVFPFLIGMVATRQYPLCKYRLLGVSIPHRYGSNRTPVRLCY